MLMSRFYQRGIRGFDFSGKFIDTEYTYSVVPLGVLLTLELILVAAIALRHYLLTPHAVVVVVRASSISVLAPATSRQAVHAPALVLVVLISSVLLPLLVLPAALDRLVSSATSSVLLKALIPELLLDPASAVLLLVIASWEATLKHKSEICTLKATAEVNIATSVASSALVVHLKFKTNRFRK